MFAIARKLSAARNMRSSICCSVVLVVTILSPAPPSFGQGYGTDSQNVMGPASGGMAGVSTARPQDVPSAIFGNPATLSQFQGTQFTLGGGWVEGYPTVTNVQFPALSYTSRTQGFVATEIGVTQDLRSLGVPGTAGMGIAGLSGLGAEYRGQAQPPSNPVNLISGEYMVLGVNLGAGVELAEGLSAGATITLGTGFAQLGLVPSTAMVHDYALRGTLGVAYDVDECHTLGAYYQTKLGFTFPNAFLIRPTDTYRNINIDQPETFGLGYANRSFLDGNLLLAADVYYKLWEGANLWSDVMDNQWAFAVGSQLTRGRNKYRLGYSYNTNPMSHSVGDGLSGLPVAQDALHLFQAASLALINQNRITAGIGREDFLLAGLDLDLFAGGLLNATDQFGEWQVSVAAYYVGMGLTWRFGPCGRHCDDSAGAE